LRRSRKKMKKRRRKGACEDRRGVAERGGGRGEG